MDDTKVVKADLLPPDMSLAEKTPKCTREFFLKAPDWRYQEAMSYLNSERSGTTPSIPTDPLVQYTIRILRAYLNSNTRRFLIQLEPEAASVLYLGIDAKHSAMTAELETLIMHGYDITNEEASALYYNRKTIYNLYSGIFMDLSGIQAVHSWMHDFLFEPEMYSEDSKLLRARILSYYGSAVLGKQSVLLGYDISEYEDIIKKIGKNERQKKLFDYMITKTSIDRTNYVMLMEAAIKTMTDRDFQEHMKDRDDAGSATLAELASNLEQGIRMYSQKELDNINKLGLDFVNQYTNTMIGKDTK